MHTLDKHLLAIDRAYKLGESQGDYARRASTEFVDISKLIAYDFADLTKDFELITPAMLIAYASGVQTKL